MSPKFPFSLGSPPPPLPAHAALAGPSQAPGGSGYGNASETQSVEALLWEGCQEALLRQGPRKPSRGVGRPAATPRAHRGVCFLPLVPMNGQAPFLLSSPQIRDDKQAGQPLM